VALYLKSHATALAGLQPETCDFTSMYTNLNHATIKSNVELAVREAMEYERSQLRGLRAAVMYLIQEEDDSFRWSRTRGDRLSLTIEDIMNHVAFVVDNTFLMTQDGTVRHQCRPPHGHKRLP